jgi:hypothetical protein
MAVLDHVRRQVEERAGGCCEYCRSQNSCSATSFSVEHIIPRSKAGSDQLSNLALSCQGCNNAKFTAIDAIDPSTGQRASLFHPRNDRWSEHFAWSHDFLLILGLTPTGRATIDRLQLNRDGVVKLRRILRNAGEHPPRLD